MEKEFTDFCPHLNAKQTIKVKYQEYWPAGQPHPSGKRVNFFCEKSTHDCHPDGDCPVFLKTPDVI